MHCMHYTKQTHGTIILICVGQLLYTNYVVYLYTSLAPRSLVTSLLIHKDESMKKFYTLTTFLHCTIVPQQIECLLSQTFYVETQDLWLEPPLFKPCTGQPAVFAFLFIYLIPNKFFSAMANKFFFSYGKQVFFSAMATKILKCVLFIFVLYCS